MSVLKAFNNHFIEFLEDISSIFPNNRDIKKSITALEMLRKTNPRAIVMLWKSNIAVPYHVQIEKGDVSFFLNKDYKNDIKNVGYDTNEVITIIENLRKDVSEMDESNQKKAMKYVQNLTKLSQLYK